MPERSEPIAVALEEARRALTYQAGTLDELRSRTGLLLAASSITGSFLGSAAAEQEVGGLGILAVVAFTVAVGACLYILWPREWTFVTSPKILLEDWVDHERDPTEMQRFLAEKLEDHYDTNRKQTDQLFGWFQVAAFAVGAEVILGSVQLATGM